MAMRAATITTNMRTARVVHVVTQGQKSLFIPKLLLRPNINTNNCNNVHQSTTTIRYMSDLLAPLTQNNDTTLDSSQSTTTTTTTTTNDDNNKNDTINQQDNSIDIVYNSPIGKMKYVDLTKARQLLFYNAQKKTKEGAWNSEQILERLVAENRDGLNPQAYVTTLMYNNVIEAWGKSGCVDGPKRALVILDRMEDRCLLNTTNQGMGQSTHYTTTTTSSLEQPSPDIVTYNTVLHAWSECQEQSELSIINVEQIIEKLESNVEKNNEILSQGTITSTSSSTSSSSQLLLPVPDTRSYNILINAYANQIGQYFYAQKAEDVLLKISKMVAAESFDNDDGSNNNIASQSSNISPDIYTFNTVLKAWRNSGGGIENAKRAHEILQLMMKLYSQGHDNLKPNYISFTTVIYAFADHCTGNRNVHSEAIDQAQEIAEDVIRDDFLKDDTDGNILNIFNATLSCIDRSKLPDANERAEKLFDVMRKAREEGKTLDSPDKISYALLLRCLAKTSVNGPKEQGQVNKIVKDVIEGNVDIDADAAFFNGFIHVYAKRQHEDQVEHLYQCMKEYAEKKGLGYTIFDQSTFNIIADMYFKSRKKNTAVTKLLELIKDMEKAYSEGLIPTEQFVYNICIIMLRKSSGRKDAGDEAYQLLQRMEQLYDDGYTRLRPDGICHNMVIAANAESGPNNMKNIEELIKKLEENNQSDSISADFKPDTYTYVHYIEALAKSKEAGKIPEVLSRMHFLEEQENPIVSINSGIYEVVLRYLVNNSKVAKEVFDKMALLYKIGNESMKPTPICCNLFLKAVSSESAKEGQAELLQMINDFIRKDIDYLPDAIGFNTVLNAWFKQKTSASTPAMDKVLSVMEYLGNKDDTGVAPDSVTYSIMLKTLADRKRVSVKQARDWFNKIETKRKNKFLYNTMLNIISKSHQKNKVTQAREILDEMIERNLVDAASYHIFLNTCAFQRVRSPSIRKQTLIQAHEVFRELKSHPTLRPNEQSFYSMMKACCNMAKNQEERDDHIRDIFRDCCSHGLVGKPMIKYLRSMLSSTERETLLANNLEGDMNPEWTRNMNSRRR